MTPASDLRSGVSPQLREALDHLDALLAAPEPLGLWHHYWSARTRMGGMPNLRDQQRAAREARVAAAELLAFAQQVEQFEERSDA